MALLTAAEVRSYHLLGVTSTNEDSDLDVLIGRAGVMVAEHLGWPPVNAAGEASIESATYTFYSGEGAGYARVLDARTLQLPVAPVTSITSIHDDPQWDYDSSDLIDSGDYVLDGLNGNVWLRSDASDYFSPSAPRAVKIVCVAGYTTIPGDIKQAAGMLVRQMWDLRKNQGRQSVSIGQNNANFERPSRIPSMVKELLAPYVLYRQMAS